MRTSCQHTLLNLHPISVGLLIAMFQGDKPFLSLQSVLPNAPVKDTLKCVKCISTHILQRQAKHEIKCFLSYHWNTCFSLSLISARLFLPTQHSISSHMYLMCVEQMRGPSVIFSLFVSTVSHNLVYTLRLL